MDILEQLKNEDDNPRGQQGGKFLSGATLEEAAAAEQRRIEMKKQRLPIGKQEAGILQLITAKTLFARLNLPEPRWVDGRPFWNVTEAQLERAGKLIGGLGGEKVRWNNTIVALDEQLGRVVGDVVISAGVVAYILTELAFWAIAFPVAAATLFFTAGHWPDLGDGADRAAVLGFVFAGANVARLAVPLRFGVAFAAAPWCDENIVKPVQSKLGGGD